MSLRSATQTTEPRTARPWPLMARCEACGLKVFDSPAGSPKVSAIA